MGRKLTSLNMDMAPTERAKGLIIGLDETIPLKFCSTFTLATALISPHEGREFEPKDRFKTAI